MKINSCVRLHCLCSERMVTYQRLKVKVPVSMMTARSCQQIKTKTTWALINTQHYSRTASPMFPRRSYTTMQGNSFGHSIHKNATYRPCIYPRHDITSRILNMHMVVDNSKHFCQQINNNVSCTGLFSRTPHSYFHTISKRLSNIKDDDSSDLLLDPDLKSILKEITGDFGNETEQTYTDNGQSAENKITRIPEEAKIYPVEGSTISDGTSAASSSSSDSETSDGSSSESENEAIGTTSVTDAELMDEFEEEDVEYEEVYERYVPISLQRGESGVFEIDELVHLLKEENAQDLCIIQVPKEKRYVDYLVIASGRSTRHLSSLASDIKWIYKKKRKSHDPASIKIEGLEKPDWLAIDIGNIAVHLFLPETREMYDLEILWTVGEKFDEMSQGSDDVYGFSDWISRE